MESKVTVVFSIGKLRKLLRQRFEVYAADLDITAPQFQVLHRLWQQDGLLTCELMRDIGSDGGTITGILDRLEGKGLIKRTRCPEDRRAVRVSLTEAGRRLAPPVEEALATVADEALAGFSETEVAQFTAALVRIGGNLGA